MIRELSGSFEEGGEKHISQPGDECEGEWENVLQVSKLEKGVDNIKVKKNNASLAVLQFSNLNNLSTNERSRSHAPTSTMKWTNQSTDSSNGNRKRKVEWREVNLDLRIPKHKRFNSECFD